MRSALLFGVGVVCAELVPVHAPVADRPAPSARPIGAAHALPPAPPAERLASDDPAARADAARALVDAAAPGWPDDHRRAFLVSLAPDAVQVGVARCLPPSVALGQAVLETGWGRSSLARDHHNLFGVKGRAVALPTVEVEGGRRVAVVAGFASFPDAASSLRAWANTLRDDPRYAARIGDASSWNAVLAAIAGTWATDPQYAARVGAVITRYHLDAWDGLTRGIAARRDRCAPRPHAG